MAGRGGGEAAADKEDLPPDQVEDAFHLLTECDSIEMLAELRVYSGILLAVFKKASRRLEASKRQQIKQWVVQLNAVA